MRELLNELTHHYCKSSESMLRWQDLHELALESVVIASYVDLGTETKVEPVGKLMSSKFIELSSVNLPKAPSWRAKCRCLMTGNSS
jgi:hypothetical protein